MSGRTRRGPRRRRAAGTGDIIRVQRRDFSIDSLLRELAVPATGGVVTFLGVVRDHSAAGRVVRLEYESFAPMAEKTMEDLAHKARRSFAIDRVAMVHRTGVLPVGSRVVAVIVAAAHRREAFRACSYLIEQLKRVVPIWKKEITTEGGRWVEHAVRHA